MSSPDPPQRKAGSTSLGSILSGVAALGSAAAGGGAVLYLAGWITTIVYHVPRNNQLDVVDANTAPSVQLWQRYLHEWTSGNTVRAVSSVAGAAALATSAVLFARQI